MRKPVSIFIVPLAAAAWLVACDSSPGKAHKVAPAPTPAAPAVEAERPAVIGEVAALAPAADQAAAPDSELRAQLLGLNKKKAEVEEASQAEPEEPAARASVRRRRVTRASQSVGADAFGGAEIGGGGLSDGEFQSTVNGWRGIQGCIAMNAGHYEDRSGALRISFEIAADGSVAGSKVVDTSNAVAQAIAPCVEKKARRLRFPSFSGDQTTKVAKFVF